MTSADNKEARFREAAATVDAWIARIIKVRMNNDNPAFDQAVMDGVALMHARPTAQGDLVARGAEPVKVKEIGMAFRDQDGKDWVAADFAEGVEKERDQLRKELEEAKTINERLNRDYAQLLTRAEKPEPSATKRDDGPLRAYQKKAEMMDLVPKELHAVVLELIRREIERGQA